MNYIKQINGFQKWILVHPGVSPSARFLWLTLLHYNNVAGWKKKFNLSMNALLLSTGFCERTIRNARNELCSLGLLIYKKGRVGIAPTYQLIPVEEFDKPDDLPIDETTADEMTTGQMKEGKTATDVTITEPITSVGDNEEVPAILPAKVRVKSYETFAPILKLNETKLNISKESTKKGSC